jgi:hypothetical protein
MRRKKDKLVKTLKIKAEISEDVKYLDHFYLYCTNIWGWKKYVCAIVIKQHRGLCDPMLFLRRSVSS